MVAVSDALADEPLLLVVAGQEDRDRTKLVHRGDQGRAGAPARDLLDQKAELDRAATRSSMLLGVGNAGKAVTNEELVEVPWILVGLVDLRRTRRELVLDELANRGSEGLLLLCQMEVESMSVHALQGTRGRVPRCACT